MILNKYQIHGQIHNRGYSSTAQVLSEDEELFFAKWIKGIKQDSQPSKILFDKLRHLKKAVHPSLPRIIEYDWDESQNSYCIIFENKEAQTLEEKTWEIKPTYFLKGIAQIISCLQKLQQDHRLSHGDITPANILVDKDFDFYLIDFGIADISATLSQEKQIEVFAKEFAAPEKWNREITKGFPHQSDIFSIGKVIEWYFNQKDIEEFEAISTLIDNCCKKEPPNRINYNSLSENLSRITGEISFDNENIVFIVDGNFDFIEELNDNSFKAKFDISPIKGNNVLIDIATKSFYAKCLWIIHDQQLKVLSLDYKESNEKKYGLAKSRGVALSIPINFISHSNRYYHVDCFNLTPFLIKIQKEKQHEGEYRKGKRKISGELKFFKDLLNEELKVMEKNALKLRFSSFEKEGGYEISFKIQESEKYSPNGQIFNHIDKATPPNPEEFEYILSNTADKKQMKNPLKFSGIAYGFNTKERVLKFKDCERLDFDKIPQSGYMFENISKQEEEKKRQVEAIRKVEYNEVQNRDLIHYLFNPTDLRGKLLNEYILEKVFQTDEKGKKICI